ncbi:hypothetical protein BGZ76_007381, partial [Entomortierella beljakovae]
HEYTAQGDGEVLQTSSDETVNDDLKEIYFVYPSKVKLFYQEVICKQTTIKHIPQGSNMSATVTILDEEDLIDGANEAVATGEDEIFPIEENELTKILKNAPDDKNGNKMITVPVGRGVLDDALKALVDLYTIQQQAGLLRNN